MADVVIYCRDLLSGFRIRETHKGTILNRRREERGIPTERATKATRIREFLTSTITRSVHMLLTEPLVGFLSLYVAFNFAVLYSFSASLPYMFRSIYGFGLGAQGLVFTGLISGYLLSIATMIIFYHVTNSA